MNRKTNLFYTNGVDSNFVTFSNYTESLTGTCISVDKKLFPSRFICMYIPELSYNGITDADKKQDFISNYLVAHYENKLAALRDDCITNNYIMDERLRPLKYLLEVIYEYDSYTQLNYISDVTEQDYNGIYTDNICIVDCDTVITGEIVDDSDYNYTTYGNIKCVRNTITDASTGEITGYENPKLYGWENTTYLPYNYDNVSAVFDYTDNAYGYYNYDNTITSITLTDDSTAKTDIKFNVVLPLYDIVNTDYETNTNTIAQLDKFDLTDINSNYNMFLPLGMWFADTDIILKRDSVTNTNSSWSLVLSSQFKPFPYSDSMNTEIGDNGYKDAFATYAQILAKQNDVLDKFNTLSTTLTSLQNRVLQLESKINGIGSIYNIDEMNKKLVAMQIEINNLKAKTNTSESSNTDILWVDGDN